MPPSSPASARLRSSTWPSSRKRDEGEADALRALGALQAQRQRRGDAMRGGGAIGLHAGRRGTTDAAACRCRRRDPSSPARSRRRGARASAWRRGASVRISRRAAAGARRTGARRRARCCRRPASRPRRRRSRRWPPRCRARCPAASAARRRCEGNLPPRSCGDGDGALVQVARAAVVAEPGPGGEHVVERRRGERLDGRPAGEEAQVEGDDGFDRRLLQHDLAEPDAVGIGALARRHAPGQVAALLVVPGEQRVDGVGTGRPERQLLSRNSSQGIVSRRPRIDPPMVSVE